MARPHTGSLARFGFTDTLAAARLLGASPTGLGLWDEQERAPLGENGAEVPAALAAAADPDLAVRQLHRIAEAETRAATRPSFLSAAPPPAAPLSAASLSADLGRSRVVGDQVTQLSP